MQPEPGLRVNLVANVHRPDALEAALEAERLLQNHDVTVGWEPQTAQHVAKPGIRNEQFGDANLVIAFGGDGTLIRAAHLCSEVGTPILGVYYGRFGFVTQCRGPELGACLSAFFDGQYRIESRMMLQTDLLRANHVVATVHALNECVVQRSASSRMMTFEVTVNERFLTSYPADGVMVSTPTGSTAYNLSAGGPIVDPSVQALLVTAIAPHTLSARPLVLGPDAEIRLRLESDGDSLLSADGQSRLHLLSGDEVRVVRSPRITNLISVEKDDFLVKLSQRLLWSQGLPFGG